MIYTQQAVISHQHLSSYPLQRVRQPIQSMPRQTQYQQMRKKIQNYSFLLTDTIGKGYSSTVYKGLDDLTGEQVAIKVIQLKSLRDQTSRNMLDTQIECFKEVKHPNVLHYHASYFTANNCYIVTQYCPAGDLARLIKQKGKFSEQEAANMFLQIFQGYKEFYQAGYVHRDLKPANIFVSRDGSLRIADFGFSKKRTLVERENYNVGTPIYMPRESLAANIYNQKTDTWALAITLYEMVIGEVPFKGRSQQELRSNIERGQINFPDNVKISKELQDFISKALLNDSLKRIGVTQMEKHPWLAAHLTSKLNPVSESPEKIQEQNKLQSCVLQEGSQQNKSRQYFVNKEVRRSMSLTQKLKLCMPKKGSQVTHHPRDTIRGDLSLNKTTSMQPFEQENKENEPQNKAFNSSNHHNKAKETLKQKKKEKSNQSIGTEKIVTLINYFRLLYKILERINLVEGEVSHVGVKVQLQKASRALSERIISIFKKHLNSLSDRSNQFDLRSQIWISFATSERWQMQEFVIGKYKAKYAEILKKSTALDGLWEGADKLFLDLAEALVQGKTNTLLLRERYFYVEILNLLAHLCDLQKDIDQEGWDAFTNKHSKAQQFLIDNYVVNLENYEDVQSHLLQVYKGLRNRV